MVPIKDGWLSGGFPVWKLPLTPGKWDVVADFGEVTSRGNYVFDNNYDSSRDFLDGAFQSGFVVADDPGFYDTDPDLILCGNYYYYSFYETIDNQENLVDVDLAAQYCFPRLNGVQIVPSHAATSISGNGAGSFVCRRGLAPSC